MAQYGALSFNGTTQYASVSSNADVNVGTTDFTLECWVKGSAAGPVIHKFASSVGYKLVLNSGGTATFTMNAVAKTFGSGLLNNAWHHVICSVDRTNDRFYGGVDGTIALDETTGLTGSATLTNTETFYVGYDGASSYLNGSVGEIRLSNSVRKSAAYTKPSFQYFDDANTKLLVHCNEGYGSTARDMASKATDEVTVGTRRDLTLTATPSFVWGPVRASPITIAREAIWYALDTDTNLTTWESETNLKRFRFRPGDRFVDPNALALSDTPALFVMPVSIPELEEKTPAFHEIRAHITVEGHMYYQAPEQIEQFWWLIVKGLWRNYSIQGGRFGHTQIQRVEMQGPQFTDIAVAESQDMFFSGWREVFVFDMRVDLQDTSAI